MDECLAHTPPAVIQLLSQHCLKGITFPLQTYGVFQILNLVFFGVFKGVKKHPAKDSSRAETEDQTTQMFKICESAGASSTVGPSLIHAGFIHVRGTDGGCTPALDEAKVQRAAEVWEVGHIDHNFEKLNGRRLASRCGFLNEGVLIR
jgi:hypothetical protein